ncbi:MAG: LacI family DNA-binding transcriptional regulator [Pseudomonadota bacterium]
MEKNFGSIRDVARETGLSTATISRVMNGSENVSPATRQKVLEACEKLDYLPNPAARALSTKQSRTIAAIIPTIEHSVFAKYIAAIEKSLDARGYSLVLAISNNKPDEELISARKLLGMGAQAFVLTGAKHTSTLLDLLVRRDVPHIFTSVWNPGNIRPTIGYDNSGLAGKAVEYLASKGHRNITVLHGKTVESDRTVARVEGAKAAASDDVSLHFYETDLHVAGGKAATKIALREHPENTAMLCFSDVLALGAYFGLSEAGKDVPKDVSVMGFDNLDWSTEIVPPLTTIDLPASEMGAEVATQIMDLLEKKRELHSVELSSDIIERGSVLDLN